MNAAIRTHRFVCWVLATLVLSGCSWFGDDNEPEEIKPNPLPKIAEEIRLDVLWSKKIGGGTGDRAVRLKPAVSGGRIFAASADGRIKAMTTDTGRIVWEVEVRDLYSKEELSFGFSKDLDVITGGVGVGGDLVVVGMGSGELLALNQSDGSLAWKARATSEVLAPPQIERDLVVVQSIDGKVTGYDAVDGERKWVYTTNTPSLTLRGTATPIIAGDIVIAAFANGRVAFLDKETGLAGYDQRVAVAQGTSDLERLVDIDGAITVDDGTLHLASFQGRVIAIELASGRIKWAENASSVAGLGSGFGNVYLATTESQLVAYNAETGSEQWVVDALLHRDITTPTTIGSYVAFTDFEGYAHVLAQADGRFVGRKKIDGSGLKSGLIAESGRLYGLSDSGTLFALEIQ